MITSQEEIPSVWTTSFVGLVLTQFLGAFNDNMIRWLAVPIAQEVIGPEMAIVVGSLCLTFPFLILTPTAGWLADRFRKRDVIIACKVAEVALMVLAGIAILYVNTVFLFSVVCLIGAHSALFGPSKFGAIPEMMPTENLSRGNGIMGMVSIIAVGLGTIAGFSLYDATHPVLGAGDWATVWPSALALVGVAISGLATSFLIQTQAAADPERRVTINPLTEVVPSLKLLWDDRRLLRTALGIAFFYFLASLAQQNIDPFVNQELGLSKTDVGLLLGLLIAGVGIGSVVAGYISEDKVELGIVPMGAIGIVVSSLLVFLSGILVDVELPIKEQWAYWGACGGLFLLGASAGLYNVPLEAYLQFRSPVKSRGTILAGSYFLSFSLIVISAGIFYLLSVVINFAPSTIFMLAGLITVPVAIYIIMLMPDLTFRFLLWIFTHTLYRLRVHNRYHIPDHGPALIVCNHISFVDGILMCVSSSRFVRFVIYADFTEMPLLRRLAVIMRVIPIRSTDGPKALIKSINIARDALKDGEVVCIFAEGQLTRTGQMQPFQRGMMKILQGTNAPVIPAYLYGLWGSIFSWRGGKIFKKWPRKWPYEVDLYFGEPIHNPKDAAEVRQEVERLGAEAVAMHAKKKPIPARQFIRQCKSAKSRVKVVDSTKQSLTGGKLLAGALALRRALSREVLGKDEQRVGLLLPPSVGGCVANMALALDRRVAVNLNYTLSEEVLNVCVKKAGLTHVLTSRKFLEKKPYNLEGAEWVFLEDIKEKVTAADKAAGAFGAYVMPASALERSLGLHRVDPDDMLTIIFTSGSTGDPKGVVLSHANVGSNVEAVDELLNLQDADGLLGVLPFFHSFGYTACMWLPMCYKVRGVYHFNPLDAMVVGRLCQENKLTIMMSTPTFLKMYLRRCQKEHFETIDLIVTGAEKLPVDLAEQFKDKFGILPTEGYGTTELSPVAAVNIPDHRSQDVYQQGTKLGTVGRPLPGVTAKVVNPDTFEDLGLDHEGLLLIKGPNVMTGYLDEAEKTAEVVKDGWYITGDFAKVDSDGFVTITGRQSRFSKIGGEMVPHLRIEQELVKICECDGDDDGEITLAVTAVPDASRGEKLIVLYTKLNKPADEVIKQLAETGFPKLWLPASNCFIHVEQIPILGTGKLDLKGVKDLALSATAIHAS
ncbi:MAG: MFS transporter [Planctomycetaceae bacterium]|nr:MFS transporter [Planctomycetaceae bacterium]